MSLQTDLMGMGVPFGAAVAAANFTQVSTPSYTVATGLTAAGTTIADALQLASLINVVGTTAASTGVKLPANVGVGQFVIVQNNGANALNVFPHSASGTLNGGSAGAAVTTAAAAGALIFRASSTDWLVYVVAKEA